MQKKLRTLLTASLILTTMATGLVGCGNGTTGNTDGATSNGSSNGEIQKPSSIKFATNVGLKSEDGFDDWKKEFTKKTGINLDFNYMEANEYFQNIELGFASGSAPDVFSVSNDRLAVYAAQGALYDMTDLVANSEYFKNMDPEVLESVTVNGKIYGIPLEKGGGTVTYIRQDWLDQLGLEVPTNYDEFINVLRAFKTLGDDVVPFTAPGFVSDQAEYYLREFYQDASPEFVRNEEGLWVDGMTEPNMVDALERMRDAYAEGLIDLEIVTNKTSTCRDKWYAGNVGIFTYWAGNWNASLENRVQQSVPTAKVTAMNAIEETHYIERVPAVISISSLCKNPEGVFKYFIEYAVDGGEGSTLFQHGVEGLHFEYDETGKVIALPKPSKADEIMEKAFVSPVLTTSPITTEGYAFDVDERITNSLAILEADAVKAEIVPQSRKLSKINGDLLAEKEKTVASIVMGQVSVEDGLAAYKAKAENLGIAQVIEELNATK